MRTIKFANPMVAAQSVARILTGKGRRFSPRPWNLYRPETELWWVIPSTKWPAYDLGKFVFWTKADLLWCGLNVEKGLCLSSVTKKQLFSTAKSQAYFVDDTWIWRTFICDLSTGRFDETLKNIDVHPDQPLTVRLSAAIVGDPSTYDPDRPRSDVVQYAYSQGRLNVQNICSPNGILIKYSKIERFSDLANELSSSSDLNWVWVDFNIAVPYLKPYSDKADPEAAVDGYQLCSQFLDHFSPWVR